MKKRRLPLWNRVVGSLVLLAGLAMLSGCGGGGGGSSSGSGNSSGSNSLTTSGTSALPKIWLSATGQYGTELYGSDGTQSGTSLIKDINPSGDSTPKNPIYFNGEMYFAASDGVNGNELWKSDGTADGTIMLKDINPGSSDSNPHNFIIAGHTLYFLATTASNGEELWKTDGSAAGTSLVKDIMPGNTSPGSQIRSMVAMGGELYFAANDPNLGMELWKSDGTDTGTMVVKDIYAGSGSSFPSNLTVMGGELYFSAATASTGTELWKSDGTVAGTVLLKDINPGTNFSYPSDFCVIGNELYFIATDVPPASSIVVAEGNQIWKTDGTTARTTKIKDFQPVNNIGATPNYMTVVGNKLFFAVSWYTQTTSGGTTNTTRTTGDIWESDGTAAGTVLVKTVYPNNQSFPVQPEFTAVGSTVYFLVNDSTHGVELWKTDGTDAGTGLVKDIYPGTSSSNPQLGKNYTAVLGNELYFTADDGTSHSGLWKTDGTAAGTVNVLGINDDPSAVIWLLNWQP